MAKYSVRLYYSTFVDVEVEADGREDAIDKANNKICAETYAQELMDNLQECNDSDVELVENESILGAKSKNADGKMMDKNMFSVFFKNGDEANDNYLSQADALALAEMLKQEGYEVIVAKSVKGKWEVQM